jgi:hypothetical protein
MGGIDDRPHRCLVRSDEHRAPFCGAGKVRAQPGQEARRCAGQGHRLARLQDLVEVGLARLLRGGALLRLLGCGRRGQFGIVHDHSGCLM